MKATGKSIMTRLVLFIDDDKTVRRAVFDPGMLKPDNTVIKNMIPVIDRIFVIRGYLKFEKRACLLPGFIHNSFYHHSLLFAADRD